MCDAVVVLDVGVHAKKDDTEPGSFEEALIILWNALIVEHVRPCCLMVLWNLFVVVYTHSYYVMILWNILIVLHLYSYYLACH